MTTSNALTASIDLLLNALAESTHAVLSAAASNGFEQAMVPPTSLAVAADHPSIATAVRNGFARADILRRLHPRSEPVPEHAPQLAPPRRTPAAKSRTGATAPAQRARVVDERADDVDLAPEVQIDAAALLASLEKGGPVGIRGEDVGALQAEPTPAAAEVRPHGPAMRPGEQHARVGVGTVIRRRPVVQPV